MVSSETVRRTSDINNPLDDDTVRAAWRHAETSRNDWPLARESESNNVRTEESKGTLSPVGNRAASVKVEGCLTASPIRRAGAKAGLSDPAVLDGKAVAQQIKGTPGITGLSPLSVHSGEEVWHLDVGSSHPGGGEAPKGLAVRQ